MPLQPVVVFLRLDHVQRELLDLGQQLGLHFAYADAVFFYFSFGWDIGQMMISLDVGIDFA